MKDKKKLLWVSPHLPYRKAKDAGRKVHFYYLNSFILSHKFDVRLISFYWEKEIDEYGFDEPIHSDLIEYSNQGFGKIKRNLMDLNYQRNPFHRYANCTAKYLEYNLERMLYKYRSEEFIPDVIILEWTQMVLFADRVKKIFPHSIVVAMEEDVTLLSYRRKREQAVGIVNRWIKNRQYLNIEREEINALSICDYISVNNVNDMSIVSNYGLGSKTKIFSPYYDDLGYIQNKDSDYSVIFYGNMSRPENYNTAKWLLDEVRPLVKQKNGNISFVIIGANPVSELTDKYKDSDVIITGYVDSVESYFGKALCMAAPLVLGAGIKVKILETMAAGVAVLTNEIGIDGIQAVRDKDYIYCVTAGEYADAICKLAADNDYRLLIGQNARKFIKENHNFELDSKKMIEWLDKI